MREREQKRDNGRFIAFIHRCVCVCVCMCMHDISFFACASARAKTYYQADKYGTLTQGYGIPWVKGGDMFSLDDSGVSCASERNKCLLDMPPVS